MVIPSLEQIKRVLEHKGYGDIWKINYSPVSGDIGDHSIPIELFYKTVHSQKMVNIAKNVFKSMDFVDDSLIHHERDMLFKELFAKAIRRDIVLEDPEEEQLKEKFNRLALIGIRNSNTEELFNDTLIVCSYTGTIFKVFTGCTNLDFRAIIDPHRTRFDSPVWVKPGWYKQLFRIDNTITPGCTHQLYQNTNITLYTLDKNKSYKDAFYGNMNVTIGKKDYGDSTKTVMYGVYVFELETYDFVKVFNNILSDYLKNHFVKLDEMQNIGNHDIWIRENLSVVDYILLEENDFTEGA